MKPTFKRRQEQSPAVSGNHRHPGNLFIGWCSTRPPQPTALSAKSFRRSDLRNNWWSKWVSGELWGRVHREIWQGLFQLLSKCLKNLRSTLLNLIFPYISCIPTELNMNHNQVPSKGSSTSRPHQNNCWDGMFCQPPSRQTAKIKKRSSSKDQHPLDLHDWDLEDGA